MAACASAPTPTAQVGAEYRLAPNFAFGLPTGEKFGGVGGTMIDREGNLHVFRRAGNVWVLDQKGKFVRQWGANLAKLAQHIRMDREGFIWIVDGGNSVIKKYNPDGTLIMTLGKQGVFGDGPDTFNTPNDVAFASNGEIFVADGHTLQVQNKATNFRVVKFDKHGKFIKAWGTRGNKPGEFELPESLLLDSRGRLIVADGSVNGRVQIFDTEGNYLDEIKGVGDVYSLGIDKNDLLYVAIHGQLTPWWGSGGKVSIIDLRTKKTVGTIEGIPGAHSVTVDRTGNVYVGASSLNYWEGHPEESPQTMCCLAKFIKQ